MNNISTFMCNVLCMALETFYTNQLASIISDVDVLNIMTWIKDTSPEKISGISRKNYTIGNSDSQKFINSKRKFLNALFQVMRLENGISLIAKAKRLQYVALLNLSISLISDL